MGSNALFSGGLRLYLLFGLSILRFAGAASPIPSVKPPLYSTKHTTFLPIQDHIYGARNVSYWVTDDGLAIIDGDVIYGPVNDLVSRGLTGQNSISQREHSVFAGVKTWPSATITYKFDSDTTESILSGVVNGAIANWKAASPYLTFTKVANSAVGQNGVAMIKAPACGGCNSAIGFTNAPLNMNLQQTCTTSPGGCGVAEATHEFGHLLGLCHEHQRADRERFVHYNCANLDPACPAGTSMPAGKTSCDTGLPSGCCGNAGNFNVLSGSAFDSSGGYDIHSIMQYRADGFARPGTNTLTPVAPGIVVPSTNPSVIDSTDANRICKLYTAKCPKAISCRSARCPSTCRPVPICNKPSLCEDPVNSPPCCEPIDEATCQHERDLCSQRGCDFLL
ncbi:hypothetical protein GALMADRAFT_283563 [Galerina marginata CBS 339.88]|uniref:Peptidase metallopeptidase domain-containing protein n=1 Tax=Galerina marginata (strain CBS 339.88) TaxID=685588 RepID=A0A067S933_GALM3|nr:hypothetical protein GALMADRAFT_283563 [Galerina marginata CBS 339.88]